MCGGICQWSYPLGTEITLNAQAAFGSRFTGWSAGCTDSAPGVNANASVVCKLRLGSATLLAPRFERNGAANDLSGMWWVGASENGWGMSIIHRATSGQLFTVLYTYNADGSTSWYVMPGGTWSDNFTTFRGAIFQPRGSPFEQYRLDALRVGEPIGELTLRLHSATAITLQYRIGSRTGEKQLVPQPF